MRKILINGLARCDIEDIDGYLRFDLSNPQAADHFADALRIAYDAVYANPLAFRLCPDKHLTSRGYRAVGVMHYILIYRYDVDTDVIHIIRIFHELQDYAHILLNCES